MNKTKQLGVVAIVPKDEWVEGVVYQKLNAVRCGGACYIAKAENASVCPGVTKGWESFWMLIAADGISLEQLNESIAAFEEEFNTKLSEEMDRFMDSFGEGFNTKLTESTDAIREEFETELGNYVKTSATNASAKEDTVALRGDKGQLAVGDPVEESDAVNLGTMVRLASNPLAGAKEGKTVVLDDIAPVPNAVKVTVESKNLVPTVYHSSRKATEFPYSVVVAGITFTVNEDRSVTLNGKNDGTDNSSFFLVSSINNPFILKKGTYIGTTGVDGLVLAAKPMNSSYMSFKDPYTVEEDTAFQYLYFGISAGSTTEFNGETVYPMLMRGTVVEDYVDPLAAGTAVALVCGGEEIPTAVGETVELFNVAKGTELSTDNDVAVLHAEYNRDINSAFDELKQMIAQLVTNS